MGWPSISISLLRIGDTSLEEGRLRQLKLMEDLEFMVTTLDLSPQFLRVSMTRPRIGLTSRKADWKLANPSTQK
jgi:hypothetical protein